MDRDQLREQLVAQRLSYLADAVVQQAAPTVMIYHRPIDEANIPVGASKIGGRPDLPADIEWPSWNGPMAFLAQFNLAELAPYEQTGLLPTQGLLSFFAAVQPSWGAGAYAGSQIMDEEDDEDEDWLDDSDDDDELPLPDPNETAKRWRVLYDERAASAFDRRSFPADLEKENRFRPCAVRFASALTLPDVDGPELGPLWISMQAERTPLLGILDAANRWYHPDLKNDEESGWQLLGYPCDLTANALLEADLEARGVMNFEYGRFSREKEYHQEVLSGVHQRWRLLLQAYISLAAHIHWNGIVHFCIEHEALARRDFGRAWLIQQTRP